MTVHYIRLVVNSSFSTLYRVLSRVFGQCYRRCLMLKGGYFYGIIVGEKYFWRSNSSAAVTITLEEEEDNRVIVEVFSYAGGHGVFDISYGVHKTYVHEVLEVLRRGGFSYKILDEIDYFTPKQTPYDPDGLLSKEWGGEEEEEVQLLPERIKKLSPCPFLEPSLDFSDIYICKASKIIDIPTYTLHEKEVLKRCVENKYLHCKHYIEGLKRQKELRRRGKLTY
ncbi:MAG: hypothetical protein ACTSXW_01500 [Candidatus Baldrarchaeia archaeon]